MIISRNTKIFLGAFAVVLIAFTIIMIVHTNKNKDSNNSKVIIDDSQKVDQNSDTSELSTTDTAPTKGVSLDDTYSYNGITYEIVSEDEDVEISYPQISGLKDETVQESINTQIKERINKILDSNNFKNNSDSSAYVSANVVANFSDVLSVKIFVKFSEDYSKNYGVNFRLDNGERIKLDEMFTGIAPTKNILSEAAYRSFAISYYTEEGLSNDFYANIEPDMISFMTDYNNGKISEFIFTPKYIEIYRNGKTVKINMLDYAEYISIYNRFESTSDLYEDSEDVAKGIPVFVERPDSIVDLYEKVNDTCVIDVIIYADEDMEFTHEEEKTIQAYKKDLKERLEELEDQTGLYYTNYVKISRTEENDEDMLVFSEDEKVVQVEEDKFLSDVYNIILEEERDINSEVSTSSKITILEESMIQTNSIDRKYVVGETEEYKEEEEEEVEEEQEDNEEEDITENDEEGNTTSTENDVTNSADTTGTENPENSTNTVENTTNNTTNTTNETTQNSEQNITTRVYF